MAWTAAIVTGASSGIGAELARQLAAGGTAVGLTARRGDALEALAAEIRARGGTAAVAAADAADRDATHAAFALLAERLGPIDLLIANAGVGTSTPARGFSAPAVEQMIRVNLLGAAYAIEAALPAMIDRGRGQVAGISSVASFRGIPGSAGYCASKAGLTALLEALRAELSPLGIAVTSVHPGFVHTPMIADQAHPQPFAMDVGPAARIILRGLAARRAYVAFPWQTVGLMTLAKRLPAGLADRLLRRVLRDRDDPRSGQ